MEIDGSLNSATDRTALTCSVVRIMTTPSVLPVWIYGEASGYCSERILWLALSCLTLGNIPFLACLPFQPIRLHISWWLENLGGKNNPMICLVSSAEQTGGTAAPPISTESWHESEKYVRNIMLYEWLTVWNDLIFYIFRWIIEDVNENISHALHRYLKGEAVGAGHENCC